jgi:hypothetical protein
MVAVPGLAVEALKDEVRGAGPGGTAREDLCQAGPELETAGGLGSQDHVHLSRLVALGRFEELEEDRPCVHGEAPTDSLGRKDMFDVAPTEREAFVGAEPS